MGIDLHVTTIIPARSVLRCRLTRMHEFSSHIYHPVNSGRRDTNGDADAEADRKTGTQYIQYDAHFTAPTIEHSTVTRHNRNYPCVDVTPYLRVPLVTGNHLSPA